MRVLEELYRLLCCPDDGGPLRLHPDRLSCELCGREFPAGYDCVSLVAGEAFQLGREGAYSRDYLAARAETVAGPDTISGFSVPPHAHRQLAYKQRQVDAVRRLLEDGRDTRDLMCDFSGGTGYYTLACARTWRRVIHCDLCVDALRQARERARRANLANLLFVRMDYFRPPFRGSLPCVVCLDTLIRGPEHERALLRSIAGALRAGGMAVVDFHNWWHNPLRRLGLLPNNFGENRSYSGRELPALLSGAGISRYECFPFRQEADPRSPAGALLARALPPTRWMFRFTHAA